MTSLFYVVLCSNRVFYCVVSFIKDVRVIIHRYLSFFFSRLQRAPKRVRDVQLCRLRRHFVQRWTQQRDGRQHDMFRHPGRVGVDGVQERTRHFLLRHPASKVHLIPGPSHRRDPQHTHFRPQPLHSDPGWCAAAFHLLPSYLLAE